MVVGHPFHNVGYNANHINGAIMGVTSAIRDTHTSTDPVLPSGKSHHGITTSKLNYASELHQHCNDGSLNNRLKELQSIYPLYVIDC